MKKYKIIITNDDGLFSEGLIPLVKEIIPLGEVCIIVPEREMSAVSHSLSLLVPVRVKEVTMNGIRIKLVSGTPADCVRLGVIEFQKKKTDVVISGINQGPNLGYDVNYSGTVAAAREAMFLGVLGVAVSSIGKNYQVVATITRQIVEFLLKSKCRQLLNINFPQNCKPKGIKITVLGERRYQDVVYKKKDPVGIPYYWLKSKLIKSNNKHILLTDVEALQKGYVSITPLTSDITNYKELSKTSKLFENFKLCCNVKS